MPIEGEAEMGIAIEIHMEPEMDEAMFDRIVTDCDGYFEEKGMHEVIFAVTMKNDEGDGSRLLDRLGIADLALVTGTIEDLAPEEMEWRTPEQVAIAAERLAGHLAARNPDVAFVIDQFAERFGNEDDTARSIGLEFEDGEGNWALLESEVRLLAKVLRWLAANGIPKVTFLQNL